MSYSNKSNIRYIYSVDHPVEPRQIALMTRSFYHEEKNWKVYCQVTAAKTWNFGIRTNRNCIICRCGLITTAYTSDYGTEGGDIDKKLQIGKDN